MAALQIGLTPVILASSANRVDVVQLLLERGADVNRRSDEGHSSIQYAASKGWKQVFRHIRIALCSRLAKGIHEM